MFNTKNLIGLPVLSLYEGELVGVVNNVYFDKKLKKVMYFLVCDQDINYSLSTKNIYKIGKNAITIKNNSCLTLQLNNDDTPTIPAPFESKTYTIQGEYLGKIEQITFTDKYAVDTIMLDNEKALDCSNLASCSKNTILVYDKSTHINVSKFKNRAIPKFFRSSKQQKVATLPIENPSEDSIDLSADTLSKDYDTQNLQNSQQSVAQYSLPTMEEKDFRLTSITLPTAVSNYPTFLIGRIVMQDILLDDKKILIKSHSTITERTLTLALANNRLRELMLYSRQK